MDWFTEEKNKIIESNLKIDMSDERLQEMQERIQGKAPEEAIEAIGYSQYDINTAIRIAMKDPEVLDRVILHKLFGREPIDYTSPLPYYGSSNIKPEEKKQCDISNNTIIDWFENELKRPPTTWEKICAWWYGIRTKIDEKRGHVIY